MRNAGQGATVARAAGGTRVPVAGFTLIELLVVVAIIGMLAAILLPVLGRARERGRRTQCLSNLGQIGKAVAMYADVSNEYLPSHACWGLSSYTISYQDLTLTTYGGHQGISRNMVIGYGGEDANPAANLTQGKLNFAPVGLGMLITRDELSNEVTLCNSMKGPIRTSYNGATYEYTEGFPQLLGHGGEKPLMMGDGRRLYHTDTSGGNKVTAVLCSYSYRGTPFYCRLKPDNSEAAWAYASDSPDLSDPADKWLAEWALPHVRPIVKAQFMCPPLKTQRALGNRALVSDSFDGIPGPGGGACANGGMAQYHHRDGYNILYGDSHAVWYEDDGNGILKWKDWADPANPGTDDLTINSMSSHKVWNLFDRAVGVDHP